MWGMSGEVGVGSIGDTLSMYKIVKEEIRDF